jgi:hypothetical protein
MLFHRIRILVQATPAFKGQQPSTLLAAAILNFRPSNRLHRSAVKLDSISTGTGEEPRHDFAP